MTSAQNMLEQHQTKVQAVRDRLDATITRINNQKGLSLEARQSRISRAYLDARKEMAQLRDSGQQALEAHEQKLIDQAFGSRGGDPQTVMAQRQAQQMVAGIDQPWQAMDMLKQAQQDGDTQLAKVIAGRAYSMNWIDVVNQWNHDGSNDASMRLINEHREMPQINPIIWNAQHHVNQPRDLEGLRDYQISRAAQAEYSDGGEAA